MLLRLIVIPSLLVVSFTGAGCSYDYGSLSGRGTGGSTAGGGGRSGPLGASGGASGGGASGGGAGAVVGGSGGATHSSGGSGSGGAPAVIGGAGGGSTSTGGGGAGGAPVATGGNGPGGMGIGGVGDADLVLWYPFDEEVGTQVSDSSGFPPAPRNAALAGMDGSAMFTPIHRVGTHALALAGNGSASGGYATLPSLSGLLPAAMTIAVWVYPVSGETWQRVFDFGNDKRGSYMFLTVASGADAAHVVRFDITQSGNNSDQVLDSAIALSLNHWHHLAVVLSAGTPYTGTIYVDGVAAGSNPRMTLHPVDLGATAQNYLGRSQYETDPYYTGLLDDFRVYRRALRPAEVLALFTVP